MDIPVGLALVAIGCVWLAAAVALVYRRESRRQGQRRHVGFPRTRRFH